MRRWIGRWLLLVAAAHTVVGVLSYGPELRGMLGSGLWNSVRADPARRLAFWFLFAGVALAFLGSLVDRLERDGGGPLPREIGWWLLALFFLGFVLAPVSGFWGLLPAAIACLLRPDLVVSARSGAGSPRLSSNPRAPR
jgi:drug/metabolite transporter (DMT)-like permease